MKKTFLVFFAMALFFCSCQKEITPGEADQPTAITGTWNFVSMNAQSQATVSQNFSGVEEKTVTTSNYTTTNNTGSITFGNADFNSNIGYAVSTNVTSYSYQNNSLFDSSIAPFQFTVPPSTSTGTYELIGTDSIYFDNGGFVSVQDTTYPTSAFGAKFSINGSTLTITQMVNKNVTEEIGGGDYVLNENGTYVITFRKK